jgi:hypothetical protein
MKPKPRSAFHIFNVPVAILFPLIIGHSAFLCSASRAAIPNRTVPPIQSSKPTIKYADVPTLMLADCDAELYCARLMINPTPPQIQKTHFRIVLPLGPSSGFVSSG